MNGTEEFVEMCPVHKVHVQRMDVRTIVAENGDHLYRYKCPMPRTMKRRTKEQREKENEEFAKVTREKSLAEQEWLQRQMGR